MSTRGKRPPVAERDLIDCGYGCGMWVVLAPVAATGRVRPFNPEYCELAPDVWLLRAGRGMVPCSVLADADLAALRQRGLRGWRAHTCAEYDPGVRRFNLPRNPTSEGGIL